MKNLKLLLVALLTFAMIPSVSAVSVNARSTPSQSTALERGYRTGYSDGYNAGYKDIADSAPRDYQSKDEYQRADRSYNEVWGPLEDYRDGYQQGFETGYAAGYDRQPFNSSLPGGLRRRTDVSNTTVSSNTTPDDDQINRTGAPVAQPAVNAPGFIPRDTILLVELLSSLSSDASQRGDRFQARVVEPRDWNSAILEGRVISVKRAGKVKGVAELQLAFDVIRLPDNRASNFSADVVEVLEMSGTDNVGTVDPEGGVKGRDSTKDDVSKVGAATGIGAIIGAIAGGGKGAAIGAAIGAGVGTGGVLSKRGKDIRLERGQQLRIRTATDTRLQ
ncbi:MAG TPA: hypothetical protein VJ124_24590 [Pyrinomonadaceae bacterium]|nr:hypothetical protein [Pyrinomonadaceae bacterium]